MVNCFSSIHSVLIVLRVDRTADQYVRLRLSWGEMQHVSMFVLRGDSRAGVDVGLVTIGSMFAVVFA